MTEARLSIWRKACPSATFFTKNPTWTGLESNPGLLGEGPTTN